MAKKRKVSRPWLSVDARIAASIQLRLHTPRLSASQINQIAFDVRDGIAKASKARALLAEFCRYISSGKIPPRQLLNHVHECFARYLIGDRYIDAAFGIKRGSAGQPESDEQEAIEIAATVLRYLLAGKSLSRAVEEAQLECDFGRTKVKAAWADHRLDAYKTERNKRIAKRKPWSVEENSVLLKWYPLDRRILDKSRRILRIRRP